MARVGGAGAEALAARYPLMAVVEALPWLRWQRRKVGEVEVDPLYTEEEEAMKEDQMMGFLTVPVLTFFCRDFLPHGASLCPSAVEKSDWGKDLWLVHVACGADA